MTESDRLKMFAILLHSKYCKGDHIDGYFNQCNWGYEISAANSAADWEKSAHKRWFEKAKIARGKLIVRGVEIDRALDVLDVLDEVVNND